MRLREHERHGTSTITYTAIIFAFSLAILLAIQATAGTQFQNIRGSDIGNTRKLNNAFIGNFAQNSNQQISGTNATSPISGNATGSTTSSCIPTDFLSQIYCTLINANNQLEAWQCTNISTLPFIGPLLSWSCSASNPFGLNGNSLIQHSAQILIGNTVGSTFQEVSNNVILTLLSDPFNQAMIALGTFLTLGILAGLLGAGILARVMVLAGLSLSMIIYIEGQLAVFSGNMPMFIWWLFNGLMTVIMIIIINEAFSKGGVG